MLKKLGPWLDEHEAAFPMNPAADLAVIYDWQSASENQWTKPPAGWQGVYGNGELPEELGAEGAFAGDGEFDGFFRLLQKLSDRHILYRVIYESLMNRCVMSGSVLSAWCSCRMPLPCVRRI